MKVNKKLMIMVHGFTGNPYNFYFMKQFFEHEGFDVWTPLLLGHDSEENFNEYIAIEWYEDIRKRVHEKVSSEEYEQVILVGLSMGAAFSIRLSVELSCFDQLILLAPPKRLKLKNQVLLSVFGYDMLNRVKPFLKKGESDISLELQRKINRNFNYISIRSVFGLSYFLKENKPFIRRVKIPTLVVHSKKDHTIPYKQGKAIYKKIASKQKHWVLLQKSFHILPLDVEKEYLFNTIKDFIEEN